MDNGADPAAAPALVWFRQDLRVDDNAALARALDTGRPLFPVFIWAPDEEGDWAPGGASRWWLHHALADLQNQLDDLGLPLVLRRGPSYHALAGLAAETGARAVYWNRRYEPHAVGRDTLIKEKLRAGGLEAESANSALLFEPHKVTKPSDGGPYQVFTPFARNLLGRERPAPVAVDRAALRAAAPAADAAPDSLALDALKLLPPVAWDGGIAEAWDPTRAGALRLLDAFLEGGAAEGYNEDRDNPATGGTSRLSPYLHWGQIGPREAAAALGASPAGATAGGAGYLRQLVWREFAHHLLYHFPQTPAEPLREAYAGFPWEPDAGLLRAWQRGETGYPLVDAGMRQLWATGWMHNRVRMVAASLLVKHLLQPWQDGAAWFWDTLVDADLANNTLGWQWVAGCGADAAPYFRVFNPFTQGEKFDPGGAYVRRFVPELAALPDKFVHRPWEAPPDVLRAASLRLGQDYPRPAVDHAQGRARALGALGRWKRERERG